MIAGIHTTKPRTQRYVDAFVKGSSGRNTIYKFRDLKTLPKENLAMYGILAGSGEVYKLSLIHISEPTRPLNISYDVL